MAGRDAQGNTYSPGSRHQDRTVEDALRTMERLATWLDTASQEDVWQQVDDQLQIAMLHGMLVHLRQAIDKFVDLGGEEVEEVARALHALAVQEA